MPSEFVKIPQTIFHFKNQVYLQQANSKAYRPYICIVNKMKKQIMKTRSILVAVFALVSSIAFANEPGIPKVVVINQKETGMFKVIYEGAKKGAVKMSIVNNEGTIVFAETVYGTDGFVRPVNFKGMEPGQYTIEIADGNGTHAQKVEYAVEGKSKKTIGMRISNNVHVAKITNDDSKYLLAVANANSEDINVKIFDGENNLVHNQTVTVNGNLGLVYNLKQVSGTPTFEITDKTGKTRTIRY